MNREYYQKVKEIFQSALEIASDERAAFLDEVCAGDETLRGEVECLLDSFDSQYLERPAVAQVADFIADENFEEEPTLKNLAFETLENETEFSDAADETTLRPNRLRFALVCLFFVVMFIFAGLNARHSFSVRSFPPFAYELSGGEVVKLERTCPARTENKSRSSLAFRRKRCQSPERMS